MADAIQLDLFEPHQLDTTAGFEVEWSYSRRQLLTKCPRWYYYQYYGASKRKAHTEPHKETLQILNMLSHRHLRAGQILHLAIGTYLKKRQHGETGSFEWLCDWAREIYREDREYSRTRAYERNPSQERYPPVPLLEFHYELPNVDELFAQSEQRLITSLTKFLESDALSHLRFDGSRPNALIEQIVRVDSTHFTAIGKIDLAYRTDNNRIVICDWKTGSSRQVDDSLQLSFYGLWAMEHYRCSPSDVVVCKVHLADETVSTSTLTDRTIQNARARILQDLEMMQSLEGYGSRGIYKAFTPCRHPRVCALCPFQELCFKESEWYD